MESRGQSHIPYDPRLELVFGLGLSLRTLALAGHLAPTEEGVLVTVG